MPEARDIRRCALQALYQMDVQHPDTDALTADALIASLVDSPGDTHTHELGTALAQRAWSMRDDADRAVAAFSPEWPTYRQPVIDRCILRLAYYEMFSGTTPPKVAVNEAIELAKEFSTEKSPAFINGILDKIMKCTVAHESIESSPEHCA